MFNNKIKRNISLFILIFSLVLITSIDLYGNSLWGRHNSSSYCSELKGHNVGDIINVIIVEKSTASQKSVTQNTKTTTLSGGEGTGPLAAIKSLGLSTGSDFQGDGQTSQTTTLSTRVTARIMKKMPNGNMLIEGNKSSKINNETQKIYVKGIIREIDILSDNTVYSTLIADAEIKMTGTGSNSRSSKPGLLHRAYDWVF